MKINVGSGYRSLPGYINVDIDPDTDADFITTAWGLYFCDDDDAEEIRMDAVYEHMHSPSRKKALHEWFRCLRSGGRLIINWIPDFDAAVNLYLYREDGPNEEFPEWNLAMLERVTNGVSELFNGNPHQLHRGLFTAQSVRDELEGQGFVVDIIEDRVYPGEMGKAYNLCVVAHKP